MGSWGTALYSDDLACDIRGAYEDLIIYGATPEEAEARVIQEFKMENLDLDESSGWLALADTEWKCGYKLSEYVKEKALSIIAQGADLHMWEKQKQKDKRKSILDKLVQQLEKPLPKGRTLHPLPVFHCPWKIGDIIEVPLANPMVDTGRANVYLHLAEIHTCKPSKYAPDNLYSEYPYFLVCDCADKEKIQERFDYKYLFDTILGYGSSSKIIGFIQLLELDMDPIDSTNRLDFAVVANIAPPFIDKPEQIRNRGANVYSLQAVLTNWIENAVQRQL